MSSAAPSRGSRVTMVSQLLGRRVDVGNSNLLLRRWAWGNVPGFTLPDSACAEIFGAISVAGISFLLGALVSRFGWIAVGKISGRGPGIGFCLAEVI